MNMNELQSMIVPIHEQAYIHIYCIFCFRLFLFILRKFRVYFPSPFFHLVVVLFLSQRPNLSSGLTACSFIHSFIPAGCSPRSRKSTENGVKIQRARFQFLVFLVFV